MQPTETMQMPALGEVGEPCAGCGAPLAADQRYCLECGQRRAGPRVDYRHYLAPQGGAEAPPPPPDAPAAAAPEPSKPERDYTPLAAVGGIAVLGLMLLVGVLIGKGDGTTAPAPAPAPIIRVPATAEGTASTESGTEASAGSKGSKGKGGGTGATKVKGGLTGEAASHSKETVQASKGDLEALNDTSGEGYQEAVKKLPDKIATPGKPPPVDKSKAPGGGGQAETIE